MIHRQLDGKPDMRFKLEIIHATEYYILYSFSENNIYCSYNFSAGQQFVMIKYELLSNQDSTELGYPPNNYTMIW